MFSANGLFKGVQCPKGKRCELINCIFAHEESQTLAKQTSLSVDVSKSPWAQYSGLPNALEGGDRKRIKLDSGEKVAISGTETSEPTKKTEVVPHLHNAHKESPSKAIKSTVSNDRLGSLKKPVSPPTKAKGEKKEANATTVEEKLIPRTIPHNPLQWNLRLQYLKVLHLEISRLNKLVIDRKDDKHKQIILTSQGIIKLVRDEEARVAKSKPTIYKSSIGHVVLRFKRMDCSEWIDEQMKLLEKARPKSSDSVFSQDPALTPVHEVLMLRRYHANLEEMSKYGFVIKAPAQSDIDEARKAVEVAGFWEACDRCSTRFQVFPERRLEDGALASRGKCTFHWGKPIRERGKEALYRCCSNPQGSPGCTQHDNHVFKTSDPKRLAEVLQFETTKPREQGTFLDAVVFDCEMGYTTRGLEVIRVSATTWPDCKPMIDVLVQPYGEILDFNTRFSGVTAEQFATAPLYDGSPRPKGPNVMKAKSPAEARDILLAEVSTQTALIGHAIDNDLNCLRIIHPTIIDTGILYPHKAGFPFRVALKAAAKQYLSKDVQIAGAEGHDSMEDAHTTGELVRAKIRYDWKVMQSSGWLVDPAGFVKPDTVDDKTALRASKYCIAPTPNWWRKDAAEYAGGDEVDEQIT